jgi:hypothetical protein
MISKPFPRFCDVLNATAVFRIRAGAPLRPSKEGVALHYQLLSGT